MKFIVFLEGYTVYYGIIVKETSKSIFCKVQYAFFSNEGQIGLKSRLLSEIDISEAVYSRRLEKKIFRYKIHEKYAEMVTFLSKFNEICKKYKVLRKPFEVKIRSINGDFWNEEKFVFGNKA